MCSPTYKGHNGLTLSPLSSDLVGGRKIENRTIAYLFFEKIYQYVARRQLKKRFRVIIPARVVFVRHSYVQIHGIFITIPVKVPHYGGRIYTATPNRLWTEPFRAYVQGHESIQGLSYEERHTHELLRLNWWGCCSFVEIKPTPHDTSWRQPCST
jgi:hypothetical protein